MKIKQQAGFSLVELMVVVAIIGILSAIATPAYQKYAVRARVSELFSIAGSLQDKISQAYNAGNTSWTTFVDLGYPTGTTTLTSNYITGVTVARTGTATTCGATATASNYIGTFTISGDPVKIGVSAVATDKIELIKVGCVFNDIITWKCGVSADTTAGFNSFFPSDCNTTLTP